MSSSDDKSDRTYAESVQPTDGQHDQSTITLDSFDFTPDQLLQLERTLDSFGPDVFTRDQLSQLERRPDLFLLGPGPSAHSRCTAQWFDVISSKAHSDTASHGGSADQTSLGDITGKIQSTSASDPDVHGKGCFCGRATCPPPPSTYEQFREEDLVFRSAKLKDHPSPQCKQWFETLQDKRHPDQNLAILEVPRVLDAYNDCIKGNGRVQKALFDAMGIWGDWHFLRGRGNRVVLRIGSLVAECWKEVEETQKPWSGGSEHKRAKPDRLAKRQLTALVKPLELLESQLKQIEKMIRNPEKLADLLKLQLIKEGNDARGGSARD